jgi:hypothetical protein
MDMLLPINGAVFATFFVLAADRIPAFNVEPHCRTIARRTGDSEDLRACLQQEQDAKEKLRRQWAQFTVAEKSYCVGLPTLGGFPIYTELLTCLELQRYVRKLRERNEGGAVKQGQR